MFIHLEFQIEIVYKYLGHIFFNKDAIVPFARTQTHAFWYMPLPLCVKGSGALGVYACSFIWVIGIHNIRTSSAPRWCISFVLSLSENLCPFPRIFPLCAYLDCACVCVTSENIYTLFIRANGIKYLPFALRMVSSPDCIFIFNSFFNFSTFTYHSPYLWPSRPELCRRCVSVAGLCYYNIAFTFSQFIRLWLTFDAYTHRHTYAEKENEPGLPRCLRIHIFELRSVCQVSVSHSIRID